MSEVKEFPSFQHKFTKDGVTVLAGTFLMGTPPNSGHVRELEVRLPKFKAEPVVNATLHIKAGDSALFILTKINCNLDVDGETQIGFNAQKIFDAIPINTQLLCSFTVIGKLLANS